MGELFGDLNHNKITDIIESLACNLEFSREYLLEKKIERERASNLYPRERKNEMYIHRRSGFTIPSKIFLTCIFDKFLNVIIPQKNFKTPFFANNKAIECIIDGNKRTLISFIPNNNAEEQRFEYNYYIDKVSDEMYNITIKLDLVSTAQLFDRITFTLIGKGNTWKEKNKSFICKWSPIFSKIIIEAMYSFGTSIEPLFVLFREQNKIIQ